MEKPVFVCTLFIVRRNSLSQICVLNLLKPGNTLLTEVPSSEGYLGWTAMCAKPFYARIYLQLEAMC